MNKILICSNDEKVREVIKTELCNDHELILCSEADQCPKILSNTKVRLLLLDINDQEDVLDFIDEIKSKHSKLKITVISSAKKDKAVNSALKAGADNSLLKPIKKEELHQILN